MVDSYCAPLVLPRCVECGVTHTRAEGLGSDGVCADRVWCLAYRTARAAGVPLRSTVDK